MATTHIRRPLRQRTKNGCQTCKIRRVRCDQEWPACQRCKNTGRACDGYKMWDRRMFKPCYMTVEYFRETFLTSPAPILSIPPSSGAMFSQEQRSMHHFQRRTVPAMSGYYEGNTWCDIITILARRHPAIAHATVALGAYHEISERIQATKAWNLDCSAYSCKIASFALEQYTTAISMFRYSLSSGNISPAGAETACILFACIESLKGDRLSASVHLIGGLSFLTTAKSRQLTIEEVILKPVLARMSLIQSLYGRPRGTQLPELLDPYEEAPFLQNGRFVDLEDATVSSTWILNGNVRYVQMTKQGVFPDAASAEAAYTIHLSRVKNWYKAMKAYASESTASPKETISQKLLWAHHFLALSFLIACRTGQETTFDCGISHFQEIVACLKSFIPQITTHKSLCSTSFSLNMGIIPTLFYTAIKCRHPTVRRNAIALLRRAPRREGLWDAVEAAKCAELVVEFEENHVDEPIGELDSAVELRLVPECARIHDVDIHEINPLAPSQQMITLRWKPDGIDGPYHDVPTYIQW